jgi:hypothetical protein
LSFMPGTRPDGPVLARPGRPPAPRDPQHPGGGHLLPVPPPPSTHSQRPPQSSQSRSASTMRTNFSQALFSFGRHVGVKIAPRR